MRAPNDHCRERFGPPSIATSGTALRCQLRWLRLMLLLARDVERLDNGL